MTENIRAQVYAKLTMIAYELKAAGVEMPDYSHIDSLEDIDVYIQELIASGELEDYTIDALEEIQESDIDVDNQEDIIDSKIIPEVEDEQSFDGLDLLSHVCEHEKIQYNAVEANHSEYGVDTVSIRVEAQNQAAVDALIANFTGSTCEMQFSYNSSGGFDLNIYNRDNAYESQKLFSEIAGVISNARDDVDYLRGLPEEIQNSQLSFMVDHPDIIDSYTHMEVLEESKNENAQEIEGTITASSGVAVTDEGKVYDLKNQEKIADDSLSNDYLANLAGQEISPTGMEFSPSADETLSSEAVERASKISSETEAKSVPASEVAGIVNMYRFDANTRGSGLDIVIQDDVNNPERVKITMKDQDGFRQSITLSCDKAEFSQSKDEMIKSMNQSSISSNHNDDGTVNYQMSSGDMNDPTTITVLSAPETEVAEIQDSLAMQNVPVKVYTNEQTDYSSSEAAFSNFNLLVMAFVVASLLIGVVIIFA